MTVSISKHEHACMALVIANDEVRRISGLIRLQFINCVMAKAKLLSRDPIEIEPCLPGYYKQVAATLRIYGISHEYPLLDCEYCTEADRLIQQRKKAQQTLGAAKRQITVLGRKSIKEKDAMTENHK